MGVFAAVLSPVRLGFPKENGVNVASSSRATRSHAVEEMVLIVLTMIVVYVCLWTVRTDEILTARRNKERFRIDEQN